MRTKGVRKWGAAVLAVLWLWCTAAGTVGAAHPDTVLPGGMTFGVRFACDGLVVVGFTEVETEKGSCMPAYDAGLRINDRIVAVNGNRIHTSEEFVKAIENGGAVEIGYERDGEICQTRLCPACSREDGRYKTGMWIRDTTAGIGTITYIEPETGFFAGLGHGICDTNTGELLPMREGTVVDVCISGVSKGTAGRPGELKGSFTDKTTGVLLGNTVCGVYGILNEIPYDKVPEAAIPAADKQDVHAGEAYIWCTLTDNKAEKYTVNITEIDEKENASFVITVTDPALIEKTGGIVQGMSGSPIIQDGKLVGA
ncbi:MAG: PDZ domain-containing protein, partial [Clostridia bacterium]|nr:PDZ domain-containing protein [Clostridia bacterium]